MDEWFEDLEVECSNVFAFASHSERRIAVPVDDNVCVMSRSVLQC